VRSSLAATLAFAVALVSAVTGVAARAQNASAPPSPHRFTFRLPGDPSTLDWNLASTVIESFILRNIMEGLVTITPELKIAPALATSWETSADGRIYTFHLRQDVKWSDGVALKARDFVFSWKRLLLPATAANFSTLLYDVDGAELFNRGKIQDFDSVGIKALDDSTLQIKLARAVPHWIYIPAFWSLYPLRQDIVEANGAGWEKPGRIVTLGPYLLRSHDLDDRVVLGANPLYYGVRGNVDEAVGLVVPDSTLAVHMFDAGQLDFCIDVPVSPAIQKRKEFRALPYFRTVSLGFADKRYPVSNPKVRRAIAMALDRSRISALHPGLVPADSFVPAGVPGHEADTLPFDPVRAKRELAAAGIELGAGGLKLELLALDSDKTRAAATLVQQGLESQLGIHVTVTALPSRKFYEQLDMKSYALFITGWTGLYPDPFAFLSIFAGGSLNNQGEWKNAEYDSQLEIAQGVADPARRLDEFHKLQKMLLQDHAVVAPIYFDRYLTLTSARASGVELSPLNYLIIKNIRID
jgi:oligopeptide transport system substrate-binding protein